MAKQAAQSQEARSKGATAPETEVPTPEEPPELKAGAVVRSSQQKWLLIGSES